MKGRELCESYQRFAAQSREKNLWYNLQEERKLRKWTSWSAHFAWGALIVWGVDHLAPLGWAVCASAAGGILWEVVLHYVLRWKASVLDLLTWWMGTIAAALVRILVFP
jgi:hypothetical protein